MENKRTAETELKDVFRALTNKKRKLENMQVAYEQERDITKKYINSLINYISELDQEIRNKNQQINQLKKGYQEDSTRNSKEIARLNEKKGQLQLQINYLENQLNKSKQQCTNFDVNINKIKSEKFEIEEELRKIKNLISLLKKYVEEEIKIPEYDIEEWKEFNRNVLKKIEQFLTLKRDNPILLVLKDMIKKELQKQPEKAKDVEKDDYYKAFFPTNENEQEDMLQKLLVNDDNYTYLVPSPEKTIEIPGLLAEQNKQKNKKRAPDRKVETLYEEITGRQAMQPLSDKTEKTDDMDEGDDDN
jgi:chromosome segregation ATPase